MKKSLQLEGLNGSEHFRQGEQKCKDPEAERSLDSLWAGAEKGPTWLTNVVWGGESSGFQLEFYFKEIKEASEGF